MNRISKEEKSRQTEAAFRIDDLYLLALDNLCDELSGRGIDLDSREGRKIFAREVRRLNDMIYSRCSESRRLP